MTKQQLTIMQNILPIIDALKNFCEAQFTVG